QRLRGHPVLAVAAVVVAAKHAERQRQRAGIGVEERLLLDRVDLQSRDVAARHLEHAAFVIADLADALEALEDFAAMAAGVAAHGVLVERLDELGRGVRGPFGEDLSQGHGTTNASMACEMPPAAAC